MFFYFGYIEFFSSFFFQENSEKPKEFLRAKPHHFPTGRATRSQTKQANSERGM